MVSCYEEGFRLTDAASECSMRSKARIDTLFEDTRSICSSIAGGWGAPTIDHYSLDPDEMSSEEQVRANGAVQARIEAMFASVEAETGTLGKSAAAVLPVLKFFISILISINFFFFKKKNESPNNYFRPFNNFLFHSKIKNVCVAFDLPAKVGEKSYWFE